MSILIPTMYGLPFVEIYGGSFDVFANKRSAIQRKEELRLLMAGGGSRSSHEAIGQAFFAETMGSAATGDNIAPAGFYDATTDATWLFWQSQPDGAGNPYDVRLKVYYHTTENWSPEIVVATNNLTDDNHGSPAAVKGPDDYIYVFYGGHNSAQKVASTTYAEDAAQWTLQTNIGSDHSYPHPTVIGSTIFLGTRVNSRSFHMTPMTVSAGVPTPGTAVHCVDFGVGTRFYQGTHVVVGNDIHLVATRADSGDTERRNIYYFVVETDGAGVITGVRNFDDTFTVAAIDLPVDLTEADGNFKIYTHPGGELWTAGPDFCMDTNSNPHVAFSKAADSTSASDILHIWHNGTAWQSVDTVKEDTSDTITGIDIVPGASGKVEVWYSNDPLSLFSVGGNMYRTVWDAGAFGTEELIRIASTKALVGPQMIRDGSANIRTSYRTIGIAGGEHGVGYLHGDNGAFPFIANWTPTNAETSAYLTRLTIQPNIDEIFWLDRLFSVIKEIGISKFDAVWYHAADSEADALLNILGTSISAINSSAAFTAGRGFTTDGIATFVSLLNPAVDGVAFMRDSAHFGHVTLDNAQTATGGSGNFDGTSGTNIVPRNTSDDITFRVNQAATSTVAGTFSALGHILANRSGASATQLYRAGAAETVTTNPNQASTALVNALITLGRNNPAGALYAQEFALSHAGGSLTAGEASTLYNKGILPLMQYKGLL